MITNEPRVAFVYIRVKKLPINFLLSYFKMCDNCQTKRERVVKPNFQRIVGNSIPITKQNFIYAVNAPGSKYEKGVFRCNVFAEIVNETSFKYAVLLFFIEGRSKKPHFKGHYHYTAKTDRNIMDIILKEMASGKFDNAILNFSFFVSRNIQKIINIVRNSKETKTKATDTTTVTVNPVYVSSDVSTNCGNLCERGIDCIEGPCFICGVPEESTSGFSCGN